MILTKSTSLYVAFTKFYNSSYVEKPKSVRRFRFCLFKVWSISIIFFF